MAYDVFLVYAREDLDAAALIARRLRALKFRVRFSKRGEDPVFDDKDARDVLRSQSVLILWSEAGLSSDWVRAAASIGHSREGVLVQAGLDDTIPYEPFRRDKRFDLAGFTSRTTVDGWYSLVMELGARDERTDLRAWMDIPNADENAKSDWLEKHPDDPLAMNARAQRDRKLGVAPKQAPQAAAAAAQAASAIGTASAGAAMATATAPQPGKKKIAIPAVDGLILVILGAISVLFLLGYIFRSTSLVPETCPGELTGIHIGTGMLEPGGIIDDAVPS